MSTILIAGIVIFAISSAYFWLFNKKEFNSAFFVSFITLISYVIMYQGMFVIGDGANITWTGWAFDGVVIYWTRWAMYGISCLLLTYEIARQLKLNHKDLYTVLALTPIVMFTGALSSVYAGNPKWVMFGLSSIAFALIGSIYFKAKSPELNRIKLYFLAGWTVFPIVFLLSPEGFGVIGTIISAAIYLALDLFTKIFFYLHRQGLKE